MRLLLSFLTVTLALITAGESHASYSSTISYDYGSASDHSPTSPGSGSLGTDYIAIVRPDAALFSDTFTLSGFADVTAASISITHNGNFDTVLQNGLGEQWQVVLNTNILVGTLSNSFYDWATGNIITGWKTDTFTLNNAALAAINASSPSPLIASISFVDPTLGSGNNFKINNTSISATGDPSQTSDTGETTPTPLPAALTLFAPGLFGLAAFRRRLS